MSEARTATELLSELQQKRGMPIGAHMEISDRCNETCLHCYQVQGQKGELSTDELKRVMDDLAAAGVLLLTLSGGESTLRADLFELIAHARQKGFAVRLFTNGLTMSEAMAARLRELAVQAVEISIYSHRAEVHDLVTGVPGSFERSVAGIRHLVAAGVRVLGKTPLMSFNEHEVPEYMAFVRSLGATVTMDDHDMMPREGGDRAPVAFNLDHVSRRAVINHLHATEGGPKFSGPQQRELDRALCGAGDGIHVEANGELRPCTMLEVPVGHALRGGVASSRAHDPNLRAMQALRWHDVHGCRDCDLQAYCNRCHAASLADVGDALAPYASACANARFKYETLLGTAPQLVEGAPGRDPATGPYREVAPGQFAPIEDTVTDADRALRVRVPWLVREGGAAPNVPPARPGQLVQLRRPGQRAKPVHMPVSGQEKTTRALPRTAARGTVDTSGVRPELMEG